MDLIIIISQSPVLILIVAMFVALSAGIAWGQFQTRGLDRPGK